MASFITKSFNKTEAAIFPIWLCCLRDFPFSVENVLTTYIIGPLDNALAMLLMSRLCIAGVSIRVRVNAGELR